MYIYIPTTLFNAQVLDFVRDGLNDMMPDFGEDTNRGQSVTEAWDFVQENVSSRNVCILLYCGTSDNGHSEEWTISLQWTNCSPPAYIIAHKFLPPKKKGQPLKNGQNARPSSPMCSFGGSTVYAHASSLSLSLHPSLPLLPSSL